MCHPRGTIPPWPASLRNFTITVMNVSPPARCRRRVRAERLLHAPRATIAAAGAGRTQICVPWLAEERARNSGSGPALIFGCDLNGKILGFDLRFSGFDSGG